MFKFVADNVQGAGTKRKQSLRPCATCKRRHVSSPIVSGFLALTRRM